MTERPLHLWVVVVGNKRKHQRYILGFPQPRAFETRYEARTYKYNEGDYAYYHVVKMVEQPNKSGKGE